MSVSQRNKLCQGTQSLNRATDSIARSHQLAAETDEIGVEIIDELGRQRETLVRKVKKTTYYIVLQFELTRYSSYPHNYFHR
jgi:hypothetical protein